MNQRKNYGQQVGFGDYGKALDSSYWKTASAALKYELEIGRKVVKSVGNRYCTPNGDPYVTLQGIYGEDGARIAFTNYAKDRNGMLYWRVPPELRETAIGCCFYMRLFIDKD